MSESNIPQVVSHTTVNEFAEVRGFSVPVLIELIKADECSVSYVSYITENDKEESQDEFDAWENDTKSGKAHAEAMSIINEESPLVIIKCNGWVVMLTRAESINKALTSKYKI